MKKLFDGPRHAVTGERIFNGIPLGSSIEASHGHLYLFNWVFGKDKKLEDINFGADIDTYTAKLAPYLNAENPDLSAFAKRGGKLIMTLGTADAVVPYHASIDYYERVIECLGGLDQAQSFFRFYVVPGLAHGGGPGINQAPNLLDAVRAWREVAGELPDAPAAGEADDPESLGDIAISYDTCAAEAVAAGKPLEDHVTHLVVHGLLHLLGYDHVRDADGDLMEGVSQEAIALAAPDDRPAVNAAHARQPAVEGVERGGAENQPHGVAVVVGRGVAEIFAGDGRLREAGLDAVHDGHETAEEVSGRHQVGEKIDAARLRDVVGVLAAGEFLGRALGAFGGGAAAEVHYFVRLSRYFQNLECCSTSCCSETGSLLRNRKSSREFLCRI